MRIVEGDNYDGDYPDESFVNLPLLTKAHAEQVCATINAGFPNSHPRYWKVVENDYKLKPGFEP